MSPDGEPEERAATERDALAPLGWGLVAGLALGVVEALERGFHLRPFFESRTEAAAFGFAVIGWLVLAGAMLGASVIAARTLFGLLASGLRPRGRARALLAGALIGALGTSIALVALTLTVRFDSVLARWPLVLGAGTVSGGVAAAILSALSKAPIASPLVRRSAAIALLPPAALALYAFDANFAPQSSYGVHVILDLLLGAIALMFVSVFATRVRRVRGALLLALVALVAYTDHAMRTMPNVKMLLRTRTAIAGRMCDLASTVEDFDRDGASMAFLVGGEDTRPFDPTVPPPLPGSRWESEEPALRPAPEADSTRDPVVAGDRPNILLLTIDACRWDLVPGARTEAPWLREFSAHTPALDSLLRVSARFDGAYTPSAGTEDTFLSLFSGLDLPAILEGSVERRLLPRRLAHAGYATAGYSNDPHFPGSAWGWPKMQLGPESEGPELARRLARFVASQPPGRRAFAWYHVMDLHAQVLDPFSIHSYSVSSHIRGYATGLERVDATIDALCSELRRLGAAERTLILLAADHGEEFGGHGHFHHNISVYEPAIRVVCWATGPGVAPGFRPYAVDLQDVYPTVLEAAGADSIACVGRSLWPALRDTNARLESRTHYSFLPRRGFSRRFNSAQRFERGQAAIVDGVARRKVLIRFGDECEEIYDLSADPLERRNLAGSRPAWADTLERELMRRVMSRPPRSFTGS